jgi:hypothetical protein
MLSPELAIEIRRVKGVKRLGTRIGDWLSTDQAQDLMNSFRGTPYLAEETRRWLGCYSDAVSDDRKPCRYD